MEDGVAVRPMGDYVLIRREEEPTGAIVWPEALRQTQRYGVVEAVGPGLKTKSGSRIPMPVAVGDRVYYQLTLGSDERGPGYLVPVAGSDEPRLMTRADKILAVL